VTVAFNEVLVNAHGKVQRNPQHKRVALVTLYCTCGWLMEEQGCIYSCANPRCKERGADYRVRIELDRVAAATA